MRNSWLVFVLACSSPPARPVQPVTPPAPKPVTAPSPVVVAPSPPRMLVADHDPQFAFADPAGRRARLSAAFPAIDKAVEAELKKQSVPGAAYGIVIDGELAHAVGLGIVGPDDKRVPDADTVYRIGSITKSLTGLALLGLRDDGVLQLDDPLVKWIPEAASLVYPTGDSQPITLRQLATHTSGLPRMGTFPPETGPTEEVIVKSLATVTLETTPGTNWEYSNLAFSLLGIAVAHAAKLPVQDAIAARILAPLGMTASVWDHAKVPAGKLAPVVPPPGAPPKPAPARLGAADGAGGLYSSVRDMAKYVAWQLSAYPPRGGDDTGKLRRATLREAHSTGVPAGFRHDAPAATQSYAFGWGRSQTCKYSDLVGHGGAIDSYRAEARFLPSRGVGVVVLTNFGMANTNAIADLVLAELDRTGGLVERVAKPSPLLLAALDKLLGIYHQWDADAFAKILARPAHPDEKGELEAYLKLHGKCGAPVPRKIGSPRSGSFALTCERGSFAMQLEIDRAGLIQGFTGESRGVEAPKLLADAAAAVMSLPEKWDDRIYNKHLAKGAPIDQAKKLAAGFKQRHGTCKLVRALHTGFDWGFELACTKENVEVWPRTAPADLSQILGLRLQPVAGEARRCD